MYDRDLGSLQSVIVRSNSDKNWRCKTIKVQQSYRSWTFDCNGVLHKKNRVIAEFSLSGAESYAITLLTGSSDKAGTSNTVELELIGSDGATGRKFLGQGFDSGSHKKIRVHGKDVGELLGLRLIMSGTLEDPWFLDMVTVLTGNGFHYEFPVRQWIGVKGKKSLTVYTGSGVGKIRELPARQIDCDTTLADGEIGAIDNSPFIMQRLICPADCQSDDYSVQAGSSIHPAQASICASAILDGVLSNAGGEVILSIVDELPRYFGVNNNHGLISIDYSPKPTTDGSSFYLYQASSPDNLVSNVRVIGEDGKLSASGRLEMRKDGQWGTICSLGSNPTGFTKLSAEIACREMGFPFASVSSEGCANVDGAFVCAAKGAFSIAAGLECTGKESSLTECSYEAPWKLDKCKQNHNYDVAVTCSFFPPDGSPTPGTLRIQSSNGAVALDGVGRLEVWLDGFGWSSVCDDDWTATAARVACKQMGYDNIRGNGGFQESCEDFGGSNFCGSPKTPIGMTRIKCDGSETGLFACSIGQRLGKGSDVGDIYCSHQEDVLVRCTGKGGDPTGGRKYLSVEPPLQRLPMMRASDGFRPTLSCLSTLKSTVRRILDDGLMPGTAVIGTCPEGCSDSDGFVRGTFIYTEDSPICKSAIHAGVLPAPGDDGSGDIGGEITIISGYGQQTYYGSSKNGIESKGASGDAAAISLLISRAMPSMVLDAEPLKNILFSGRSAFGGFGQSTGLNFLSFTQEESKELVTKAAKPALPPVIFQWSSGTKQMIPASNAPVGAPPSSFTAAIVFSIKGGASAARGQELRLYVNGDCGGFGIFMSKDGEITAEQTCNPHTLTPRYFKKKGPDEAEDVDAAFVIIITYDAVTKFGKLYVNGKLMEARTLAWTPIRFLGDFSSGILGMRHDSSSSLVPAEVNSLTFYDGVLSSEEIQDEMNNLLLLSQLRAPSNAAFKNRYTIDGRPCKGMCINGDNPDQMDRLVEKKHEAETEKSLISRLFGFFLEDVTTPANTLNGAASLNNTTTSPVVPDNSPMAKVRQIRSVIRQILGAKRPALLDATCNSDMSHVARRVVQSALSVVFDGDAEGRATFLNAIVSGSLKESSYALSNKELPVTFDALIPDAVSVRITCPAKCPFVSVPHSFRVGSVSTSDFAQEAMDIINNMGLPQLASPSQDDEDAAFRQKPLGVPAFMASVPICVAAIFSDRVSKEGGAVTITTRRLGSRISAIELQNDKSPSFGGLSSKIFDESLNADFHTPLSYLITRARPAKLLSCESDGLFTTEMKAHGSRDNIESRVPSRLVTCPANCARVAAPVYGDYISIGGYSPKSSICRAAIHAGILNDKTGGEMLVEPLPTPEIVNDKSFKHTTSRKNNVIALPPHQFVQYMTFRHNRHVNLELSKEEEELLLNTPHPKQPGWVVDALSKPEQVSDEASEASIDQKRTDSPIENSALFHPSLSKLVTPDESQIPDVHKDQHEEVDAMEASEDTKMTKVVKVRVKRKNNNTIPNRKTKTETSSTV